MTRMRVNGVEQEVAVTTVTELLVARGVDPADQLGRLCRESRRCSWRAIPLVAEHGGLRHRA